MTSASGADLDAARATLPRAVRAAGALQLRGAASAVVQTKGARNQGEADIVTNVDRECEDAVVELIRREHPTHPILAEEGTGQRVDQGPLWILDPLDGTKNYAHGLPRFGCALAFAWNGVALLGAVYNPVLDELFVAERERGATLNGAVIRVSGTVELGSALVASAFTVRRQFAPHQFERLERLVRSTQGLRVGGCASLDLCDVARGRLDAYFEEGLDPWDTAAGALVVREAGGSVTDFRGEPHQPFGAEMLASNGPIGEAVVETLRRGESPE